MSMGLRPYRFACEACNRQVDELHFTYINRQPCHVCHDCLRTLIAANVARVAGRAREAGRLGGEVSAEEEYERAAREYRAQTGEWPEQGDSGEEA